MMSGQIAAVVHERKSAQEVIAELMSEAEALGAAHALSRGGREAERRRLGRVEGGVSIAESRISVLRPRVAKARHGRFAYGRPGSGSTFACASDVLGYDLADAGGNGFAEKLNDTRFAQPAICAFSVGIARALMARGVVPSAVLGFSLGQVAALAVSGMLSEEETYRFVKARAEFMAETASAHAGAMSALLKADDEACPRRVRVVRPGRRARSGKL